MNRGLITRKRLIQWDSFPQVLFPTGHLRSLEVNIGHWRFSELWWPRMTSNDIDETEKSKTSFICRRTGFYWITSDFGTHWRIFPRFTQGIFSKPLLQIIIMTHIIWLKLCESTIMKVRLWEMCLLKGQKLFPNCSMDRHRMRVICETINAGMQPLQNLSTRFIHVVILKSLIKLIHRQIDPLHLS